VLEEHVHRGGLGMQVQARANEIGSNATVVSVHLGDVFLHTYGSKDDLLEAHGITLKSVTDALVGTR
ncbi:MAG: transketolase, partial [Actinomycetota bacterium]|nr:transketolase [Actinomycetota bacterium]